MHVAVRCYPKEPLLYKQGWTNAEQGSEMIAYVNCICIFEQEDDVVKSLEADGTLLDDRHIRVDNVKGASQHKHLHLVFVGNLPFTITMRGSSAVRRDRRHKGN